MSAGPVPITSLRRKSDGHWSLLLTIPGLVEEIPLAENEETLLEAFFTEHVWADLSGLPVHNSFSTREHPDVPPEFVDYPEGRAVV